MKITLRVTYSGIVWTVALVCLLLAFLSTFNYKAPVVAIKALPPHILSSVSVSKGRVVVQSRKSIKTYQEPKFRALTVLTGDRGEVTVQGDSWMPALGFRPMLGVTYLNRFSPVIVAEVVRIEPLGIGASILAAPPVIGIGLEKDMTTNISMGGYSFVDLSTTRQGASVFLALSF
jgi:hypothetical protein